LFLFCHHFSLLLYKPKKEKKRKEIKNEKKSDLTYIDMTRTKKIFLLKEKRTKNEKMHFWWKKIWWVCIHFIIEMTLQSENRLTPLL
jgi:hypothetical protein